MLVNQKNMMFQEYFINQKAEIEFEKNLLNFKQAQSLFKTLTKSKFNQIEQQYQQKRKLLSAQNKIFRSSVVNRERMRKLLTRSSLCNQIFDQVKKNISIYIRKNVNQYKLLLIYFIVQGIIRLFEEEILIRCLPQDEQIIQSILQDCIYSFDQIMYEELGRNYKVELRIDKQNYLKFSMNKIEISQEDMYCIGGVILTNVDRNIIYKNTIDCRLNIMKQLALPDIRENLWPKVIQQFKQ